MLSPEVQLRHINPVHWTRLVELLLPPPGGDPKPSASSGGLSGLLARTAAPAKSARTALSPEQPAIVLMRGGRALRIFRVGGGRMDQLDELARVSQQSLREFRLRHNLPYAAAVDLDRLPTLWRDVQAAVFSGKEPAQDYVAQMLAMANVGRAALGKGLLVDPPLVGNIPTPSARLLQTTFDRLLPDGKTVLFYLLQRGAIYTSLIALKVKGDIRLVTTHDAVADAVRVTSLRDVPALLKVVSRRFGPPHVGIFLPLELWHQTVAGDHSAIARALPTRRAVIEPAPAWLLAVVGAGAMADVAARSGRLAGQLLSASKLGSQLLGGKNKSRLANALSNPLEALGLDPWEMLRWSRDWRRRVELDRSRFGG